MPETHASAAVYPSDYHDEKRGRALIAARRILPLALEACRVDSLTDVGCGPCAWLQVARELGLSPVIGIEGEWGKSWVPPEVAADGDVHLHYQDLEAPLDTGRCTDLAVCLELAEHLSAARADSLVADLCRVAPRVLFSAAIPGQGGNHHINEQWPSYWAQRFAQHGYRPLDIIRPRIWTDYSVPFWYRQNTLLYVRESEVETIVERCAAQTLRAGTALDVVHPRVYAKKNRPRPGPRHWLAVALRLPREAAARAWRRITRRQATRGS